MHAASEPTRPPRSADHLRLDGVSHAYGDRRVLTSIDLVAPAGARLGVIGENGAGKSTLLRIIAGAEQPDAGTVSAPRRVGLLRQEVSFAPDDTVGRLVEAALAEVRAAERELQDAADALARTDPGRATTAAGADAAGERYARALAAAEGVGVWTAEARRDAALAGLGVGGIDPRRRIGDVSGGQRSRLALAALLLERPDALVLDEPTNHLDDAAAAYLVAELTAWSGPVVFASHDRVFLDEAATAVLDIDPAYDGPRRFGGGYSDYLAEKAAERARWEERFAAEEQEVAALTHAVEVTSRSIGVGRARRDNDKMGYDFKGGTVQRQVARRVRNAQGRLDELRASRVARPPAPLVFGGLPPGATPPAGDDTVLALRDGAIDGRMEGATLAVASGTALLITGPNGAGKSTLLGALAGRIPLDAGSVSRRPGLRVGLLEQDVRFPEPRRSPRDVYERALGGARAGTVPLADLGLVAPRDLDRPVGDLSVGQQRRLALALVIARPPHVLLLDEPTNHLSLALASELEEALGAYPGAVLIASHDRWLRRRWHGAHLRMEDGRTRP